MDSSKPLVRQMVLAKISGSQNEQAKRHGYGGGIWWGADDRSGREIKDDK